MKPIKKKKPTNSPEKLFSVLSFPGKQTENKESKYRQFLRLLESTGVAEVEEIIDSIRIYSNLSLLHSPLSLSLEEERRKLCNGSNCFCVRIELAC